MDRKVSNLLRTTLSVLESLEVPYAIGGAVAMAARGFERATKDVDVFFIGDEGQAELLAAFREAGLHVSEFHEPFHYGVFPRRITDPDVRVDLLFTWDPAEIEAINTATPATLGALAFRAMTASAVAAVKFEADEGVARAKDQGDVRRLLRLGLAKPDEVVQLLTRAQRPHREVAAFAAYAREVLGPTRRAPSRPAKRPSGRKKSAPARPKKKAASKKKQKR